MDVSHKVLRTDNVLTIMYDLFNTRRNNFQSACNEMITGKTVLTRYNNKNYKVHDIDYGKNPTSTFTRRVRVKDGEGFRVEEQSISYIDYYKKVGTMSYDVTTPRSTRYMAVVVNTCICIC